MMTAIGIIFIIYMLGLLYLTREEVKEIYRKPLLIMIGLFYIIGITIVVVAPYYIYKGIDYLTENIQDKHSYTLYYLDDNTQIAKGGTYSTQEQCSEVRTRTFSLCREVER